jgi:DNA-binding beta-propeller fold protein YncE
MADVDKWGQLKFYRLKPGGFEYYMEDNPKSSKYADWGSGGDVTFDGGGVITMHPNGPTDFGIGKNISGFSDSNGGCSMNFKDTAAKGYSWKQDDARDIEFKAVIKFSNIDNDDGFSISACTGHHTGSGCCQGFAYMGNMNPNTNPSEFRFRKEMTHPNYNSLKYFTHPKCNFQVDGHDYIGFGFCRYNKRKDPTKDGGDNDSVILEMWFNPDPQKNPLDWTMIKRMEDKNGAGFGSGGGKCHGADDQAGVWSGAQNRMKTNSSGGTAKFKCVSLREIDPFEYTPGDGSGGGGDGGGDGGGGGGSGEPLSYTYLRKFGSKGSGNGQFQDPHDLTFLANGDLFVCDRVRNDVQRFTHDGVYISKFASGGSGNGQLNVPYAIEHDSDENLYVMDRDNNRIQKFTTAGVYITKLTAANGKNFNSPEDIVFDPANGDMYICDTGNNRIVKLDKNHNFILEWGHFDKNDDANFDHPHSSKVGPDGNYYVSCGHKGFIQVFSPTGVFMRKFASPGSGDGQLLIFLEHMDIDKFGRLHIVNNNLRPIVSVFDCISGAYLTKYGSPEKEGSANGQFREPEHVTIDADGKPFVVDAKNQRIQVFSVNGGTGGGGSGNPPPPTDTTGTIAKPIRDIFNINVSPAQSCSGLPSGVLPFTAVYDLQTGSNAKEITDDKAFQQRIRVAEKVKTSGSRLYGKRPRKVTIPLKKVGSPGGQARLAVWDEKTTPAGGNKIIEMGTINVNSLSTNFVDTVFYNEAAPLYLPQGLKLGWFIGIEYTGTSATDYIVCEYNGSDPIDGASTIMAQLEKQAPTTDSAGTITTPDYAWQEKSGRDLRMKIEI